MPSSPPHSNGELLARMGGGKPIKSGRVVSVQGPVVDVHFNHHAEVPDIQQVIMVRAVDGRDITLEVAEHLPGTWHAVSPSSPP